MGRMGMLMTGVVLGFVATGLIRYATLPPLSEVHYHANWALFVDGERVDLSEDRFMEDVGACLASAADMRPQDRVHMHEGVQDVVHVHAGGATWGHLLANLGYAVGPEFLIEPDGRSHIESDAVKIHYIKNGQLLHDIANEPISSGDRLLISVGPQTVDEAREDLLPQVASNAEEYNSMADPATCRGGHEPEGTMDRLRRAFLG